MNKKIFYGISVLASLIVVALLVYAYGGSDPSVHGHSALEVEFPAGAVMAFNLESCPDGWVEADGTGGTPDLRGTFIRGMNGDENGRDVARALKSYQVDDFKSHNHGIPNIDLGHRHTAATAATDYYVYKSISSYDSLSEGGDETRPKNVALLYCVKT